MSTKCDQCQELMIQGVRCHETGCPNIRKEREAKLAQERADDAEDEYIPEEDAEMYPGGAGYRDVMGWNDD